MIRLLYLSLFWITLSACGGGGGGGGKSDGGTEDNNPQEEFIDHPGPIAMNGYEGKTSFVRLNQRNAKPLFIGAAVVIENMASFVELAWRFQAPFLIQNVFPDSDIQGASIETNDDGSYVCEKGYSRVDNNISSVTGVGKVTSINDLCVIGGLIIDGSFSVALSKSNNTVSSPDEARLEFNQFIIYGNESAYGGLDGVVFASRGSSGIEATGNFYVIDSQYGSHFMAENLYLLQDGLHPTSGTRIGHGKIYSGHYGYVNISYENNDDIVLEGAENTKLIASLQYGHLVRKNFELNLYTHDNTEIPYSITIPKEELLFASFGTNIAPNIAIDQYNVAIEKDVQITFSAEESTDTNYDFLSFQWDLVSAPADCSYALNSSTIQTLDFISQCSGNFLLAANVSDGELYSQDNIKIHVYKDRPEPRLSAEPSSPVNRGESVQLSVIMDNEDQGPFEFGVAGPPSPLSFDSQTNTLSWLANIPMLKESATVTLPVYAANDRLSIMSPSIELMGNNEPFFYKFGSPVVEIPSAGKIHSVFRGTVELKLHYSQPSQTLYLFSTHNTANRVLALKFDLNNNNTVSSEVKIIDEIDRITRFDIVDYDSDGNIELIISDEDSSRLTLSKSIHYDWQSGAVLSSLSSLDSQPQRMPIRHFIDVNDDGYLDMVYRRFAINTTPSLSYWDLKTNTLHDNLLDLKDTVGDSDSGLKGYAFDPLTMDLYVVYDDYFADIFGIFKFVREGETYKLANSHNFEKGDSNNISHIYLGDYNRDQSPELYILSYDSMNALTWRTFDAYLTEVNSTVTDNRYHHYEHKYVPNYGDVFLGYRINTSLNSFDSVLVQFSPLQRVPIWTSPELEKMNITMNNNRVDILPFLDGDRLRIAFAAEEGIYITN